MNEQEWVTRWEEREVTFRKEIKDLRGFFSTQLKKMGEDVSGKQKQLLRIRALPIIGKWLIRYSENGQA